MAGDLTNGMFHRTTIHNGHHRCSCGVPGDQRAPLEDARVGEEHVGVDRATGDLAVDEKSPVNQSVSAVSAVTLFADQETRLSVSVAGGC